MCSIAPPRRPPLVTLVGVTLLLVFAASARPAAAEWVHPFHAEQPDAAPAEVLAVIEIPAGRFTKYEIDAETGHLMVDRVVRMPVVYPVNYGSIARTHAADGDPLDVLVFTREPLYPGSLVRVRPVAVLKSLDDGEQDDKIVAVPASKIDTTYDEIQDLGDLPKADRQRLEAFFRVYKQLKTEKVIEVQGWAGAAEARKRIATALERFEDEHDPERQK